MTEEERQELEAELRALFPDLDRLSQEEVDEIVRADAAGETYFIPGKPASEWKWEVVQ